jgi:hypothetical protein
MKCDRDAFEKVEGSGTGVAGIEWPGRRGAWRLNFI